MRFFYFSCVALCVALFFGFWCCSIWSSFHVQRWCVRVGHLCGRQHEHWFVFFSLFSDFFKMFSRLSDSFIFFFSPLFCGSLFMCVALVLWHLVLQHFFVLTSSTVICPSGSPLRSVPYKIVRVLLSILSLHSLQLQPLAPFVTFTFYQNFIGVSRHWLNHLLFSPFLCGLLFLRVTLVLWHLVLQCLMKLSCSTVIFPSGTPPKCTT